MARLLFATTLSLALLTVSSPSRADEPWLLHVEPSFVLPVGAPQSDWFGPGLSLGVGVSRPVHPIVLLGARLRGGLLFDGPAPADQTLADPGIGTFMSLLLNVRLRPLAFMDASDPRRGTGLWVEGSGGLMLTGRDFRGTFEAAVGYGFELGPVDLGPVVRYIHTFQPSGQLDDRDAHLLAFGVELTLFDARREEPPPPIVPPPSDRDADGIIDSDDSCPDEPEDFDDFEDEDGCPDPDNDQDRILDVDDSCPLEPEDYDGFADADGCPDPDNDHDGFLDEDDTCPDDAEIINGVDDDDGCPDEGLIEFISDRIVLEGRVLFDFERARVKHRARPTLAAIVELIHQHPEWIMMRIEGHTDSRGDEAYNQRLSERRAHNTMRALVQLGVDQSTIESQGYGNARLRDPQQTEEAHQNNRRVEFVVLRRRAVDTAGDAVDVTSTEPTVEEIEISDLVSGSNETEASP